jgi:hypothetical protein
MDASQKFDKLLKTIGDGYEADALDLKEKTEELRDLILKWRRSYDCEVGPMVIPLAHMIALIMFSADGSLYEGKKLFDRTLNNFLASYLTEEQPIPKPRL